MCFSNVILCAFREHNNYAMIEDHNAGLEIMAGQQSKTEQIDGAYNMNGQCDG